MLRAFRDLQQHSNEQQNPDQGPQNKTTKLQAAFNDAIQKGPEARDAALALATDGIVGAVATMLYVDVGDIDAAKSVAELGVDSLIAAELRSWFLQAPGANISMLDLLDPAVSITSRAATIVDKALDAVKV